MFRPLSAPLGALCFALLASASPASADPPEGPAAVADDPVILTDRAGPPWEAHAKAGEDGERRTPPPSESRALGVPNGVLSARPAAAGGEAGSTNPLAALDPRTNELTRVLAALAVVLGLLVLLRLVLRRAAGGMTRAGRPSGVLEILARYPVARGQSLVILKVARRVLLVHQTAASMTTLSEMTDGDEVAALLARMEAGSGPRGSGRFRSVLRTFEREHERLAAQGPPTLASPGRETPQVIDLTRSQMKGLGGLLGRRRISA